MMQGQVLRGSLWGGAADEASQHAAAFVGQDDTFHSHLTVEETLMLAASLRIPGATRAGRRDAVDQTLQQLQLTHARHTRVGNERVRGISGGERRRLALGCELLGDPRVVFADEPTSGLDAFQAERMMSVLRGIAAKGCTVVVTIHQPSSKVWRMFDDIMLLSGGRTVYFGHRLACLPALAAQGYKCPLETNPAEFVLDVISVDASSPKGEITSSARVMELVQAWARHGCAPLPSRPSATAVCCGLGNLLGGRQGGGGGGRGREGGAECDGDGRQMGGGAREEEGGGGGEGRRGCRRKWGLGGVVARLRVLWVRIARRKRREEGAVGWGEGVGERGEGGDNTHTHKHTNTQTNKIGARQAFVVLLVRSLKEMARNSFVNGIRMAATLVLAGLFGVVWGGQQSVVDRIGSVVMVLVNLTKLVQVKPN
jgi:ABC-type multidrug transport system ATPase subunit